MNAVIRLLWIPLLLLLAGCWDQLELEEQAFVVVIGLDKAPRNMVAVTFQIANPQVGSSDKGVAQKEPASDIVTFTASDILSAKELANSVITRKISFAHLKTVIVSQELSRSKFYHRIMGSSIRDPEMRREIHLIVSKEKASEFIANNKPRLETRPHKYYAFMQERWRDTGFVPYSTLNRYFQRLGKDTLFLTIYATTEKSNQKHSVEEDKYKAGEIPQKSGDPVQLMGSAVFRTGKMIGTITGEETRMSLLLRRKSLTNSFITTYTDPLDSHYRITARLIKEGNTRIWLNMREEPISITVKLPLRLQILSIPSFINYDTDTNKQLILRESLHDEIIGKLQTFISKTQTKFKAEPFLWHLNARRQFRTLQAYEEYDWSRHFASAHVKINLDLRIENFGKQMELPAGIEDVP